jgi:putative spermidine/putrescine transport system permease protein
MRIGYVILAILLCSPIALLIYLSFVNEWTYPKLFDANYTLENWKTVLNTNKGISKQIITSLFISISEAIVLTLSGFVLSWYISKSSQYQKLVRLSYFTYIISPVILINMLQYYFLKLNIQGSLSGVLVGQYIVILPFVIIFFSGFWNEKIHQTIFQSTTLGATFGQSLRKIVLPLAKYWLLMCLFLCFVFSWFDYSVTKFIGLGEVETISLSTMNYLREANPHYAAISALLLLTPLLVIGVLARKKMLNKLDT